MSDTKAIIQFIGLCLFTDSRGAAGGVTVLLPKSAPTRTGGKATTALRVEEHSSAVLFRDEDLQEPTLWETKEYRPDPSYQYACIGDTSVTFQTGTRLKSRTLERTNFRLPHLKPCCNLMSKRFPSVKEAVAVVRINEGVLNTCVVNATEDEPVERTDTWLSLPTSGSLRITATPRAGGGRRTLVLKPNANVFVSNLPSHMVMQDHDHADHAEHAGTVTLYSGDVPHYEAYYNLLQHDKDCTRQRGFSDRPILGLCPLQAPKMHYNTITTTEAVSSECSNTTWP